MHMNEWQVTVIGFAFKPSAEWLANGASSARERIVDQSNSLF